MAAASGAELVQPPTITVDGRDLDATIMEDLLDLRVSLTVHAAAMAQARFEDGTFTLLDKDVFKVGGTLAVSLPTSKNQVVSTFTGEVVSIGVDQGRGGRHELVVTAFDRAHRLSAVSTHQSYLNQATSAIVRKVAQRHGLTAKVSVEGAAEPYVLQTGTDHAFLCELADAAGAEWYVDGKTLHMRKRPAAGATTLTWGEDLLRFQARYSAADAAVTDVTVRGWDPTQQKAVTGSGSAVLGSPTGQDLGSDAPLAKASHGKAKSAFGKKIVVGSAAVRTAAEAKALATAMARELLADAMTARGECVGNPKVKPGEMVTIASMGTKLSGKYYVTEVEHVFGVGRPLVTRFNVSGARSPLGGASTTDAADGRSSNAWGRAGVVVGVVTNLKDPEKQGRVKVKFPTLGDQVESQWARVVQPGAGTGRGVMMLPEVGDEVIVAFDRGDRRLPVVLGGVWSAKNKLPLADAVASDGSVAKRTIKTRAGHVIELSDGKKGTAAGNAQRYVKIALADGKTKVHVGEDKIEVNAADGKPITIKAGKASVALSGSGDVTVKGVNVTLEGSAKVTIKAPQVVVDATSALQLKAAAQAELKAAMVKVEASGIAQIKGSMLKLN